VIAPEVGLADGQQPIERDVDHLLVEQFLGERIGTQGVFPVRPRQEVLLHPGDSLGERLHDSIVGGIELLEKLGVISGGISGPVTHGALEEADRTRTRADRQVGELFGRIINVRPQCLEHGGSGFQAGDDRAQPGRGGSKVALHQAVDGSRGRADVAHRIVLPRAQNFQVEQFGLESAIEHFGVDCFVLCKLASLELVQPCLEGLEGCDPFRYGLRRAVFQPVVILVQPGAGASRRFCVEGGVEVIVHEDGER
jgi:hypothetical protein